MHSTRFVFVALIAGLVIPGVWAHPHPDPRAMAVPRVRFNPVVRKVVGVDYRLSLTTAFPMTAAAVLRDIRATPDDTLKVQETSPHHFLIMPKAFWPANTRVRISFHDQEDALRTDHVDFVTDDAREIRIDLSTQTLSLWQQGQLIRVMPVSTGVNPKWTTPSGIFEIYKRVRDDRMKGGKPNTPDGWDVKHVPYAQYFDDAIALHGAWWNHRFGIPKSHGCIQLRTDWHPKGHRTGDPDDARDVWHFSHIGTPVEVYGTTPDITHAPSPYP